MAKWTSNFGTVIDIPNGLSTKQINEIKTLANNKYGTKAADLAKQYGALSAKAPAQQQPAAAPAAQPQRADIIQPVEKVPDLGVKNDGTIDSKKLTPVITGAAVQDQGRTILGQNANTTDALGNNQEVTYDPVTGAATVKQKLGSTGESAKAAFEKSVAGIPGTVDLSGAPKILTAGDFQSTRDQTQQALYKTLTQNNERNRARDLEAQKQELANRGIVYNPGDTESGYGKAIGAIDERYKTYEDQALQQSIAGSTEQMAANAGVNNQAYQNFVNSALQTNQDARANVGTAGQALGASSGNFQAFQGAGTDNAGALAQIAALEQQGAISKQTADIQRAALRKQGSGGGGSSSGFAINGEAP